MGFRLVVLVFSAFTAAVQAVPGFKPVLQQLHPELTVSCRTCHSAKPPSRANVSAEGKKFYEEVLSSQRSTTAPALIAPGTPTDFIVYGDSRDNPSVQKKLVNEFCSENPRAVFHTGDIVGNGGSSWQWRSAMKETECLITRRIFYPACGNHEGNACLNNALRKAIGNTQPYYKTKVGDYTFLALDSIHPTGMQETWLASLPPGNYIPYFHYPPYPTLSGHGADDYVLKHFIPLFQRLHVKLVFTGHNHGYDRAEVDGITYVTTGGGGAPLYPCGKTKPYTRVCVSDYHSVRCQFQGKTIVCEARKLDGQIIDSFRVD